MINQDKIGSQLSAEYGEYCAVLWGGKDCVEQTLIDASDNPLEFALFGLARQEQFPDWVKTDWDKPVLDMGPGNKLIQGADRLEYPEYNFEGLDYLPTWYHSPSEPNLTATSPDGLEYLVSMYHDEASTYRACLPYETDSVGGIYAVNILEHLHDPRPILREMARVLAPGCPMNIFVPHATAGVFFQDLDHKKPFILDTWDNWINNKYWGPDRSALRLRIGCNFKFGIKEENTIICTQLIKLPS